MQQTPEHGSNNSTRPTLLNVLCILSYIAGGIASISYFAFYSAYEEMMPMVKEMSEQFPTVKIFLGAGKSFFITGAILYFISIIGVSLMWRMKKAGFHFYTGAQIMILLMPVFYLNNAPIPFLDGLITVAFIMLYARFYRLFT